MSIEAYEVAEDGSHIAVSTGASPPGGSGAHTPGTGLPAETASGDAAGRQGGSAPQQTTPPPGEGLVASQPAEEDDADVPDDTATVPFVNRRIKQLNAKRRALEQQVAAERQQFQQEHAATKAQVDLLTKMLQGAAPDLGQTPTPPPGPPQAEQYASMDDYTRAQARYEAQQLLQERDRQTQAEREQAQQATAQEQLAQRVRTFQETHLDYERVMRAGYFGHVATHVDQIVSMIPDGPALAYALAQHPEVIQRLNTLPPPQVIWELARLAPPPATNGPPETHGAPTPPPPAVQANGTRPPPLPEPMRPVGGGGSTTPPAYRDDMSQSEFKAWRARTSNLPAWKARTG